VGAARNTMTSYYTVEVERSLVGKWGSGKFRLTYRRDETPRGIVDFLVHSELIEDLRPEYVRQYEAIKKGQKAPEASVRGRQDTPPARLEGCFPAGVLGGTA